MTLRARVYNLFDPQHADAPLDRAFNAGIVALILLNVAAAVLNTVPELARDYAEPFQLFENASILVFTVEYLARVWTAVEDPRFAEPLWGRLRYMATPTALIDAIVIVPALIVFFSPVNVGLLRVLRLLRVFRLLKLARYSRAVQMLGNVMVKQADALTVTLTIGFMILVLASSLMYLVEHAVQPKAFPHIPAAMWWGVATLTTVGYGDVYPMTTLGRFLGGCIAVLGVGLFALPAGILASGISEELEAQRRVMTGKCPRCGADC